MIEQHNVLLICDINFKVNVKDYNIYYQKLINFLTTKNKDKDVNFSSVNGKYNFNEELNNIDVDEKNKSSFIKSIDDYLNKYDEIVIITNYIHEPYLEGLRTHLNEENKPTTVFSYEVREEYGTE